MFLKRLFYHLTIYASGIILLYFIVLILTYKGFLFDDYPFLLLFIKPVQVVGILPEVIPQDASDPERKSILFWLLVNISVVYIVCLSVFLYGVSKLFDLIGKKRKN